jgi:recombination protein RecT
MSDNNPNNNGESKALAKGSLRWYLESPDSGYLARLQQLLGKRAPQFCSSLVNLANSSHQFTKVRPQSIISAGVIAATLDLPIDKNLGFAWIIPYGELAQFQIGYKGYVQLALRSGRYEGMNAVLVNAEALGGFDNIGDPLIKWDLLDETQPPVGYAFAWRLTTGFTKVVYWPKTKVEAHARKYSQAFKQGKKDSPWVGEFDKMALKTLITNALRRWGIMSVEDRALALAFERDQSAAIDVDAIPIYPDNDEPPADPEPPTPPATTLSDLTEKLTEETAPAKAEPAPTPDPIVEPAPWEVETEKRHGLTAVPSPAQPLMDLEAIKERLSKAAYVADVRTLLRVWMSQAERSESQKLAITDLCNYRITEIKSAGTAQKG